jgi:hypothetical protein
MGSGWDNNDRILDMMGHGYTKFIVNEVVFYFSVYQISHLLEVNDAAKSETLVHGGEKYMYYVVNYDVPTAERPRDAGDVNKQSNHKVYMGSVTSGRKNKVHKCTWLPGCRKYADISYLDYDWDQILAVCDAKRGSALKSVFEGPLINSTVKRSDKDVLRCQMECKLVFYYYLTFAGCKTYM